VSLCLSGNYLYPKLLQVTKLCDALCLCVIVATIFILNIRLVLHFLYSSCGIKSSEESNHPNHLMFRETRNAEHGTRNTEHGTRNTEHGTRNAKHGTRNAKHGTRNAKRETFNYSRATFQQMTLELM